MRQLRIQLCILIIFCCFGTLVSQYSSEVTTLDPISQGYERWSEVVKVSGGNTIGVMNNQLSEPIPGNYLYTYLSQNPPNESVLCAEVISIDGKYEFKKEYSLEHDQRGTLQLNLDSDNSSKLIKQKQERLAILVYVAKSCNDTPDYYLPASWNHLTSKPEKMHILVNSELPMHIFYKDSTQKNSFKQRCKTIKKEKGKAFNCLCSIPTSGISGITEFNLRQRESSLTAQSYNWIPVKIGL